MDVSNETIDLSKKPIKERTDLEKERLLDSMIQRELLRSTRDMNTTLQELTKTLKVLEKHEYLELHRNKWKLVGYNILLGVLFAFGTVFGLVLLSWLTFNFFKDSVILKQIVENQLHMRQINIGEIQEKVKNSLEKTSSSGKSSPTTSGSTR